MSKIKLDYSMLYKSVLPSLHLNGYSEVRCHCPFHDDHNPSLSINIRKGLWNCFAGCGGGDIYSFYMRLKGLDLRSASLEIAKLQNHGTAEPRVVAMYEYKSADGILLYTKERIEPGGNGRRKEFLFKHRKGTSMVHGRGCGPVPYNLPALNNSQAVYIVEGEGKADILCNWGIVATSFDTGASSPWIEEYSQYFRGKKSVIILPDADVPGDRFAARIATAVIPLVDELKVVRLPNLHEGEDIDDWSKLPGNDKVRLLKIIEDAPNWNRTNEVRPSTADEVDEHSDNGKVNPPLPMINAENRDLPEITRMTLEALLKSNDPPSLFKCGGILCRLETDDESLPVIREMNLDQMRHRLARSVSWIKRVPSQNSGNGTGVSNQAALPPMHVVRDLLASPNLPFPRLTRIVATPIFSADGHLQTERGYHPSSGTLYFPAANLNIKPIPKKPSDSDISAAKIMLVENLLGDFPFTSESERAHALSAILLPFIRELINGPTPLHLIEAPSPGTGKSLLADIISTVSTGRPAPVMTEGKDDEEWRKRLTAKLKTAPAIIILDDLHRRLDSSALAAILSVTDKWEDRLLGTSETVRLPVRCLFVATGNNVSLSGELARRTVRIRLDARTDRPWLRNKFRHANIRIWMTENLSELVYSALLLIQAWLSEKRPGCDRILGRFDEWSGVIGGILSVAGIDGFLGNLPEFYDDADTDGQKMRRFIVVWAERFGTKEVGVLDLWPLVDGCDDLLNLGDGNERSRKSKLGRILVENRDRQFDNWRILHGGTFQRAHLWKLVPANP